LHGDSNRVGAILASQEQGRRAVFVDCIGSARTGSLPSER
jgi:hypothetical protein